MSRSAQLAASFLAVATIASSPTAKAYNAGTHQRIVEAAIESMQYVASSERPSGVDNADWELFVNTAIRSATSLQRLRTGLEPPFAGSPVLGTPRAEPVTISNFNASNWPDTCSYHQSKTAPQETNLLHTTTIQISDFGYYPKVATQDTLCAYDWISPDAHRPGNSLGPVLGRQAQRVDEYIGDTKMWFRPTNSGIASVQVEAAQRIVDYGLAAVILPFYCLAEALFGNGCNTRDAFDLAEQVNPITFVSGLFPGVGDVRGADYVGVWHFIDVDASLNRYNDRRGMFYENAGPSYPGALDVAIMAMADLTGLSLNASIADGPKTYGRHDRVRRTASQWQAHTIGHTEFSPIDNLGQYGWELYVRDPTSAFHLGRPLHALGDAAEPQHVAGTTSWGHRPFEDAVDNLRGELLPSPPVPADDATVAPPFAFRDRVLRIAFDAWRAAKDENDVHGIIRREARATRDIAARDGDWVYKDLESVNYQVPALVRNASVRAYEGGREHLRPFLELAVGYAIAFLAKAGAIARDPGPDPDTLCPVGTYFTGLGNGCSPGTAPIAQVGQALTGDVRQTSSCVTSGGSCTAAAECCDGIPCLGGYCQSAPVCRASGQTCTATAECCAGTCAAGTCQPSTCKAFAESCATSAECCSSNCVGGACSTILK